MEAGGKIVVNVRSYFCSDGKFVPMVERLELEKEFKINDWGISIVSIELNMERLK